MTEAREIASSLTKASKRALPQLSADWIEGERPSSFRDGVYSLGWGKDATHCLIERRWKTGGILEVRLTPLGLTVRAILKETSDVNSR